MAQHLLIPPHICMLDGPDYPNTTSSGKSRYDEIIEENDRLKALLLDNGISWAPQKLKESVKFHKMKTRKSAVTAYQQLPHLPMEIQLRILGFAMKCPFPIIDPFSKPRLEHLTKEEQMQRKKYPVQGRKLFFNNSFVFTQVITLEAFSLASHELRSTIKSVDLRVVGKYYDDEASKRDIFAMSYHPTVQSLKIPIHARPKGAALDHGIHAYCWQQFTDFMKHLQISSKSNRLSKLFPSLMRMKLDLVNFCEHLHFPGPACSTVLRWHTGPFLDELIVTGIPEDDPQEGPEHMFTHLVKDEGVFGTGPPLFVSQSKFLKPLTPLGLAVRVIRADEDTKIRRLLQFKDKNVRRVRASLDPADGKPPKAFYAPGKTIWKFTQDSLKNPERRWIEFDRESGFPADDIEMWSDEDDLAMYGSDENPFGLHGDPLFFPNDDMEDDMEDDDDMPALLDT
ncbi:hypothetical protein D0Z07_4486 [Hyphodiscus hymeniophilus]|uniref:Uncharacterized protein n=1 Tax=Hyphodiscus hymeniophilus TaxID=353542 RepID=A0A9P7AXX4_9HELO|nr:hypothetical protein D0Z07_4486 [Hyphodiscus hymeniophilus]